MRLVAGLADGVPALPDDDVQRAVGSASAFASTMSGHARSRRPARDFAAVAAAAVVALTFLVQLEARPENSSPPASGSAPIATFPDGTALQLLLSGRETR